MATFMTTSFTAPDRRKKVVTYGKSSRLTPTPTSTSTSEAPSPERPRKQSTIPHKSLKKDGQGNKTGSRKGASRDTSPDIFDVPSEDEFVAYSTTATKKPPTQKPPTKRRMPTGGLDVLPPKGSTQKISKNPSNTSEVVRKAEPARSVASMVKASQAHTQVPKARPSPAVSTQVSNATSGRQGKTPRPGPANGQDGGEKQILSRPIAKAKVVPRTTTTTATPLVPAPKAQNPTKVNTLLPSRSILAKATAQQSQNMDIFDMPSSEDDLVPTPKASLRHPPVLRKESAKAPKPSLDKNGKIHTESDDSTSSRKRKRRGSIASTTATAQVLAMQKSGSSLPQRSVKHHKKKEAVSPGHKTLPPPAAKASTRTQNVLPAINKPRRTRVRTVPILTHPSTTKAQSSPAVLSNMLPGRAKTQPSATAEVHEATVVEDDTMYDIPDALATPLRPASNSVSGSITPRQKALFGSLLGNSSTAPSMPSISKLQLTDSKPKSLLGALSRSKSELTPSVSSHKAKLITKLKHIESSSDDDSNESESGSDGEATERSRRARPDDKHKSAVAVSSSQQAQVCEEMNMDIETAVAVDSQTSQTSGFNSRQKLTYAKSRSYLQEDNPEDAFLMSMDMDDPVASASQTRDSQTEEEEEASQVRANHELRRQGQNSKFEWENLMLIDDISGKSSSSIRRSALLELCTKMADTTFAHELLDSSLVQQFLDNLTSKDEIIFDFTAAVATIFMLRANPTFTMLDQIYRSEHVASLPKLLDNNTEVQRIAKNRKTNLSKIAQDSVIAFCSSIMVSNIWSPFELDIISPQLVVIHALDMLVLNLREAGSTEPIIDQDTLEKLVDIVHGSSERCKVGKTTKEDSVMQRSIFSTLEAVSLAKQNQLIWSARLMQRLATSMSGSFQVADAPTVTMAVKLCMNLTNNKPKACEQFAEPAFVQSLVRSIIERIKLVQENLVEGQRTEALDTLILSLGAMINLTEHSDQARLNADDGKHLLETLVETFVEGSSRTRQVSYLHTSNKKTGIDTTQATSMEESQSSVAVGYLSVLLGNLCLNKSVQAKIRTQLPGHHLTTLVDKIKEFVQVHEHANRKAKQYEGDEGQQTWQNYTARIMLVVEQLERAKV
jgi:hypothetical protein